jgi:DNA-binding Lrp family transcriptional regulator
MQREDSQHIVLSLSTKILLEDKLVHQFLAYLKLRSLTKDFGGNIPSIEKVSTHLNLSERKCKLYIKQLLNLGWIRKYNNHYQIVSMYRISENENHSYVECFSITDSVLNGISWKNISRLKSVFAEMVFERKQKNQDIAVKLKAKEELKQESKGYIKPTKSQLSSYKQKVGEMVERYWSCSYSACLINKSQSTAHRYRSVLGGIKKLGKYKTSETILYSDNYKMTTFLNKMSVKAMNESLKETLLNDRNLFKKDLQLGFYFKGGLKLFFIEASKRKDTFLLFKTKNYCKNFKKVENFTFENPKNLFELELIDNSSIY